MKPQASVGDGGLPLADWQRIDSACDGFEAAWRAGGPPDLEAFLAETSGPLRSRLFRELLTLDLEFRLGLGQPPMADDYLGRFPGDREVIDEVFGPGGFDGRTIHPGSGSGSGSGSEEARPGSDGAVEAIANRVTQFGAELPRAELSPAAIEALRESGYEILGELGRGGMGVVYLARKVALNRLCALKMILAGAHAGSAASARFRAEAEMVARLRHPDIVQIYHVGEANGLSYLELEFLRGGSLDQVLDGIPRPAAEAARLLEVIARAIAEAHRQGIVHRDLKPANILLDKEGHPKVADFGLAKILDSDDGLTRTQMVLGSPSYMAPEQAEGRSRLVGPTTDVYALGAILYELVTGRPPFRAATALETLAQVKESEPFPPSQFQPGLSRDVETICLKCLEKVPGRRYPSADALAEDLHRYLAGEPILARPASSFERAWKWARRRPGFAATLGVGAACVALLLGGALYYNARLRVEVQKARAARIAAIVSAQAALEERNLALKALNQLVYEVQEKLGDSPATRPIRQGLLDTATLGLDEIAQRTQESAPDLSRAVAHQKLGDLFRQIGRGPEARRQLELARQLAEDLAAVRPHDPAIAECLGRACFGLGELDMKAGAFDRARRDFRRAAGLAEVVVRADPGRAEARRGLLEADLQLGRAYAFAGEYAEAGSWFRKTKDLAERWVADDPRNLLAKDMLAWSYRKLADNGKLTGDIDSARTDYLRAIAIGRDLLQAEPGNLTSKANLAVALDDLAGVLALRREFAEAESLSREAVRLFEELADTDPERLEYQRKVIHVQANLAAIKRDQAQFAEASDLFELVLERMLQLQRDGRPAYGAHDVEALRREVADCEVGPEALGDLDRLKSRPARDACRLLRVRARALSAQGRLLEAIATVEALFGIKAEAAEDLLELARGLSACLVPLEERRWPRPPSPDLRPLRSRCADRAVAVLGLAIERGQKDPGCLVLDDALKPLHQHPGYLRLVEGLKAPAPSASGQRR